MKRDLIIIAGVVIVAAIGIGGVFWWQMTLPADDGVAPIRPKTEPIALVPKKEDPAKFERPVEIKKKPVEPKKKPAPEKKIEVKKIEPIVEKKKEPTIEVKAVPKKIDPAATKLIVLDNITKINDPEGEFTQPTINGGQTIVLIGVVKKLTIAGLNEKSTLDASRLEAEEIVFTGHINGGSKALLGKSQKLTVRDINDRSTLNAAQLGAKSILVEGAVNGISSVKLHAPGGVVEFRGELNDRAQIDVAAEGGKIFFKGRGDSCVNGGATIKALAKDVAIEGTVNGPDTSIEVTLTKSGSLQFHRLNGGVRMEYRKADASDPAPRIDAGLLDARAFFGAAK